METLESLPTWVIPVGVVVAIVFFALWRTGKLRPIAQLSLKPAMRRERSLHGAALTQAASVLDAETLGVLFARAKRREAFEELDHATAKTYGEQIKSQIQGPFVPKDKSPAGAVSGGNSAGS